jgi:hypothetical protein
MEVLTRVRAADRQIDFGVTTTRAERAAILAQRFRVYQRHGYYHPDLTVDHDAYDRRAIYLLAVLRGGEAIDAMLGSARFVLGQTNPRFRFPAHHAFDFELPAPLRAFSVTQCGEVSRMVSERVEGMGLGGFLTPLGLIQTVALYSQRHDIPCGLAIIKRRFVDALSRVGVRFHEIAGARLIYPGDGPASPYFYRHRDPVVPVYWLVHELAPSVERALARLVDARGRSLSSAQESTRNDSESATTTASRVR